MVVTVTAGDTNVFPVFDTAFGNSSIPGAMISNAFAFDNPDELADSAIDSQGRMILAGTVNSNDFTVARLNADGSLDHSFGVMGRFSFDLGLTETVRAVTVDSQDNIYIAGENVYRQCPKRSLSSNWAAATGGFDTTFNSVGFHVTTFGESNVYVGDVLAHSDGSIWVGAGVNGEFRAFKYSAEGILTSLLIINVPGSFDNVEALAEQSDGKVIIAGHSADEANNFTYDFALARINNASPLSLDESF